MLFFAQLSNANKCQSLKQHPEKIYEKKKTGKYFRDQSIGL